MAIDGDYLGKLAKRAKESKVYKKYQLIGLEIARVLKDEKHKSLYIKLAKENNPERLLRLARDIAERKNIKSAGAYFMKVLQVTKNPPHRSVNKKSI